MTLACPACSARPLPASPPVPRPPSAPCSTSSPRRRRTTPPPPRSTTAARVLTYRELADEVDACAPRSPRPGSVSATASASASPPARPSCTSRSSPCSRPAPPTCRSTPTTPTSAPSWCSARPQVCAVLTDGGLDAVGAPDRDARPARARRRRLDHLHLRLDRASPKGVAVTPPLRRRVRRRRGAAVPAATSRSAPATGSSPGCRSRSTPPARRCGWPGGTAPAWCRPRARWCAPASTSARGCATQRITVVSTVPTLAALWPADALEDVRLLIFGGEACPPELAERVAVEGREVWNTYGPTEATVVACAAQLTGDGAGPDRAAARRLGARRRRRGTASRSRWARPASWSSAASGWPATSTRPRTPRSSRRCPSLGWDARLPQRRRGPRRARGAGVPRPRRRAGQARRAPHRAGRGRRRAAGAARRAAAPRRRCAAPRPATRCSSATSCRRDGFDRRRRRGGCASGCRPRWCRCWPWWTSCRPARPGKVDRDALPWPLHAAACRADRALTATEELARRGLGRDPRRRRHRPEGRLLHPRRRQPHRRAAGRADPRPGTRRCRSTTSTCNPRLGALAAQLDALEPADTGPRPDVARSPRRTGVLQALLIVPLLAVVGLRWTAVAAALVDRRRLDGWSPGADRAVVVARRRPGWCCSARPAGSRSPPAAPGCCCAASRPGTYPRGGSRAPAAVGGRAARRAVRRHRRRRRVAGPPATPACSARGSATDVDLHSAAAGHRPAQARPRAPPSSPRWTCPATGSTATSCTSARSGSVPAPASASRSTLLPGARIGKGAEVVAGSTVHGAVPAGAALGRLARRPRRQGRAARGPPSRPARSRSWVAVYGADVAAARACCPRWPRCRRLLLLGWACRHAGRSLLALLPVATVAYLVTYALLVLVAVRLLGVGMREGYHPVHGRVGWQVWTTERLMGMARIGLFPLYASLVHAARGCGCSARRSAATSRRRRCSRCRR